MTKKEFVELYAKKGQFASKAEAERSLNAFFDTLGEALVKEGEVSFIGTGKFEVVKRAPRTCMNPQTKKLMTIPEKKAIKFKAGKSLTDLIV